jgi:GT2 family glycosyltransferase
MKLFSVIIPTMWRFEPFKRFLFDLLSHEYVTDVVLIDNDPDKSPVVKGKGQRPSLLTFKGQLRNLTYLPQDQNIYVNPAWNLGVEYAKTDKLCILNDDLIFDLRVFERVSLYLDSISTGGIFLAPGDFPQTNQPPLIDGMIDIVRYRPEMWRWGFGMLMFIHKSYWEPIPDEMKLFCGDDWIFDGQQMYARQNYVITNMFQHTPYSVTSSQFIKEFDEKDREIYGRLNRERKEKMCLQ